MDDINYLKTRCGKYTENTVHIKLGCGHVPIWTDQASLIHRYGKKLRDGSTSEHVGIARVV